MWRLRLLELDKCMLQCGQMYDFVVDGSVAAAGRGSRLSGGSTFILSPAEVVAASMMYGWMDGDSVTAIEDRVSESSG